jgi:hypothetical protein
MNIQFLSGVVFIVFGIIGLVFRNKFVASKTTLHSLLRYYINIGFILTGAWNIFIVNLEYPFVKWLNNNFVYVNAGVVFLLFLAIVVQQLSKKK